MKTLLKYQLKYWLPVYAYLILIFYFSSQSILPGSVYLSAKFHIQPYVQHILMYTGLALLLYRAVHYTNKTPNFLVILSTTLYGLIDEIHQYYVPGRSFDILDILMDFSGAVLALILIKIFKVRNNKKD